MKILSVVFVLIFSFSMVANAGMAVVKKECSSEACEAYNKTNPVKPRCCCLTEGDVKLSESNGCIGEKGKDYLTCTGVDNTERSTEGPIQGQPGQSQKTGVPTGSN